MTGLKDRMIGKVLAKGGKPAGMKSSLDECFTYDNQMCLLVLWYSIGNSTKTSQPKVNMGPSVLRQRKSGFVRIQSKPSYTNCLMPLTINLETTITVKPAK